MLLNRWLELKSFSSDGYIPLREWEIGANARWSIAHEAGIPVEFVRNVPWGMQPNVAQHQLTVPPPFPQIEFKQKAVQICSTTMQPAAEVTTNLYDTVLISTLLVVSFALGIGMGHGLFASKKKTS